MTYFIVHFLVPGWKSFLPNRPNNWKFFALLKLKVKKKVILLGEVIEFQFDLE